VWVLRRDTCADETGLFDSDAVYFFCDGQDGKTDFLNPESHVISDTDTRCITQRIPEIFGSSVSIGMFLQVITDTLLVNMTPRYFTLRKVSTPR
jgi:hypothetical protein